jgi:hypothetical protein
MCLLRVQNPQTVSRCLCHLGIGIRGKTTKLRLEAHSTNITCNNEHGG